MRALTYIIIVLFAVFLFGAAYYTFGGPVPHGITWNGDPETPFVGRYLVATEGMTGSYQELLEQQGTEFEATYPHYERLWAPRNATILASAVPQVDQNVYTSIRIDRASVTCAQSYKWGDEVTIECDRVF